MIFKRETLSSFYFTQWKVNFLKQYGQFLILFGHQIMPLLICIKLSICRYITSHLSLNLFLKTNFLLALYYHLTLHYKQLSACARDDLVVLSLFSFFKNQLPKVIDFRKHSPEIFYINDCNSSIWWFNNKPCIFISSGHTSNGWRLIIW